MGEKYRVAVCDDEKVHLDSIVKETQAILTGNGCDFSLATFASGNDLLNVIRDAPNSFDLLLLDILFEDDDGIEVARELRRRGCSSTIIFITCALEFATEGYEVNAFRYLLKPVNREKLSDAILFDYRRSQEIKPLAFYKGSQVFRVDPRNICFVETSGRGVILRCTSEDIVLPYKISEIESLLPSVLLVRCHKSFIAGVEYIEHFDRDFIVISGKGKIPVGRKYHTEVRRTLINHLAR